MAPRLPERTHGTRYRIRFRPYLHMLARGNDPLRMFRELRELGDLRVSADVAALPPFEELDPENCYLSWQLELNTDAPRQSVIEVFDWAEGDCELEVIALEAAFGGAKPMAPAAEPSLPHEAAASGPAPIEHADSRHIKAADAARSNEAHKAAEVGSIRVSVEKIDDLMNSVGELVITQSMLGQLSGLLHDSGGERLRAGLAQLERNVRELQESVMRVRMVPITLCSVVFHAWCAT